MPKRDANLLLEDMHQACERIISYTHSMDYETFLADKKTIDATVRNIQILGEAAQQIPESLRKNHAQIEWTKIIRSRHIVVHEYFELDYEIIWRIITDYIPPLKKNLENILN